MNFKILVVVCVFNNEPLLRKYLQEIGEISKIDLLIVDDGSSDKTYDVIEEFPNISYIKHDNSLGPGASITTGFQYALDYDYDAVILQSVDTNDYKGDVDQVIENINYGYDIVNLSRILENYDHSKIPPEYIKTTLNISDAVNDTTGFDLTDPLSGILGIKAEVIKHMEFTEFNHALLLQLWIQAAYYNFSVIEIPAINQENFGTELNQYEDPYGYFLSVIETEKFLYGKKTIN